MNQIIQPFGRLMKKIEIKADDKGLITVEAFERNPLSGKWTPMDSRHMVLALQKISMDYCAVMFQNLGGANSGKTTENDSDGNSPQPA